MAQAQQAAEDAVDLAELREVIVSIIGLAVLHERAAHAGGELTEAERADAKYLRRLIREHGDHLENAPLLRGKKGHFFTQLDAELLPQVEPVKQMLDAVLSNDETDDDILAVLIKHLGWSVAPVTANRVTAIKQLLVGPSADLRQCVRALGGARNAAREVVWRWSGQRSASALKQAATVLREKLGPEAQPHEAETMARGGMAPGIDVLEYLLKALGTPPGEATELMKLAHTFAAARGDQ